jgi:hypothetical protein
MNAENTKAPDTRDNVGYSGHDIIRMDAKRSRRFWNAMSQVDNAIEALAGSARAFPHIDISEGTVDPATIVKALTDMMREKSFLIFAMLNDNERSDETLREKDEDDHA